MKFLETKYKLGTENVNFKPFIKQISIGIKKYVDLHISFFKDGKTMPYKTTERILDYYAKKNSIPKANKKDIEYFQSKISNNENLFLNFYERVERDLKSLSFKEKISVATVRFSESMWQQKLSNLDQFRLHELFYKDYIEWQKLKNYLLLEKETGGFNELFTSPKEYEIFLRVLTKHKWMDKDKNVKVKLKSMASILKLLKNNKVIHAETFVEISEKFEKTFNTKMWKSYFSEVDDTEIKNSNLYKDLLMEFSINDKVQ